MITKEIFKKMMRRIFPEIAAGLHVPIFAVVESISDAPKEGDVCDVFRPHFAVDVRLLKADWSIDDEQPMMMSVPCAMQNVAGLPKTGTVVELAFAYGRQSQPFVRSVLPFRQDLPSLKADEHIWQGAHGSQQKCDADGNWSRETEGRIADDCFEKMTNCVEKIDTIVNEDKNIKGYSTQTVGGLKKIVAGALKFLTTGSARISAADNISLLAGKDAHISSADRLRAISPKVYLGNDAENVLQILSDFMATTQSALTTLANHNHDQSTLPAQKGEIEGKATEVTAEKGRLDPIIDS